MLTKNTYKTSDQNIDYIKNLVKLGSQEIVLDDNHKNVVLVLGNTGSGKSTLTHLLAGDNDNVIAKEVGKDTGEFKIEDLNDKISQNSTIFSKTIYPELVIDEKTEIGFYDCPGFSDTRNSSMDIANTYFIRRVIDHAESVKLLFTVNHNSLKIGMDRIDFMTLMKHATTLIKNIEKFEDSIMLIATKVDNSYKIIGGTPTLVPDSNILANIEDFLNITKKDVESNLANDENLNKIQDAKIIKLIDILLTKNNNELSRIALFRRPDRPGKLTDIELTQNGKKIMNNIVHEILQFSPKTIEDFGYTISEDTTIFINNLIDDINSNIIANIKAISKEIIQYYQIEEKEANDIYDLIEIFNLGIENLTKLINMLNSNNQIQPNNLILELRNFGIPISENLFTSIKINEENFHFLQKVNEEKNFAFKTNDWLNEMMKIENIINNSNEFYDCLIILFINLSEYEVQSNLKNYSVSDLLNQIQIELNNSKPLRNIIKLILDTAYSANNWPEILTNVFENIEYNMKIDELKVKFLYEMLNSTLNTTINVDYFYEILQIHGDFIRMSDVNKEISKIENQKIRVVEIYALNKFFIDEDFTKMEEEMDFHFVVIASTWEIIGNRKIILDGKNGVLNRYQSGLPGKPGGPAGTFLGFGNDFWGIENLVISANGGNGSNGANGKTISILTEMDKLTLKNLCGDFHKYHNYNLLTAGGSGGYGGPSGEIFIYQTTFWRQQFEIYLQAEIENGMSGTDGLAYMSLDCYSNYMYCDKSRCTTGEDGGNLIGKQYPLPPNFIGDLESIIKKFQNYCNNRIINSFVKRKISYFSDNLSNSVPIPTEIPRHRIQRSLPDIQKQHNYEPFSFDINRINYSKQYANISDSNQSLLKNNTSNFSIHNLNSTLALMDLFTRKILGTKRKFIDSIAESSYSNNLADSLNIIEEYEKLLAKLTTNMKIAEEINVDGSILVGKLQNLLTNGKYSDISKLLYDSVKINNKPILRKTNFGIKLQEMITKILKKYENK